MVLKFGDLVLVLAWCPEDRRQTWQVLQLAGRLDCLECRQYQVV